MDQPLEKDFTGTGAVVSGHITVYLLSLHYYSHSW